MSDADTAQIRRIHITGGPGSGKSWLAHRLAKALGVDVIDLDGRALQIKPLSVVITEPHEYEALIVAREADLDEATAVATWVCEGAFVGNERVHYERADIIVWVDVPWQVASYRIASRHVKAELRRSNRFPGWPRSGAGADATTATRTRRASTSGARRRRGPICGRSWHRTRPRLSK